MTQRNRECILLKPKNSNWYAAREAPYGDAVKREVLTLTKAGLIQPAPLLQQAIVASLASGSRRR